MNIMAEQQHESDSCEIDYITIDFVHFGIKVELMDVELMDVESMDVAEAVGSSVFYLSSEFEIRARHSMTIIMIHFAEI